ncbi:hypothetical protein MAR_017711 [Mya arenaria]|uniref:Uncharacterized protein n=1 Tax=Mya arenaria TaxID=6604 RepID=A0ABY7ECL3_MYAAR|nr:hypothetical protein MAR_017711 [Mya arenaria]
MGFYEVLREELADLKRNRLSSDVSVGGDDSVRIELSDNNIESLASLLRRQHQANPVLSDDQFKQLASSLADAVASKFGEKIKSLENENNKLRQRVQLLENQADAAQQYSRRNILRISGVPEVKQQITPKGSTP